MNALADRFVSFTRRTAYVLDPVTVMAVHTLDRQPLSAGPLRLILTGAQAGTGTVTVAGSGTGAFPEVVMFAGNGERITAAKFGAITGVTTTGLTSESPTGTLAIMAIGADGNPKHQNVAVVSGIPARYAEARPRWPNLQSGSQPVEQAKFMLDYSVAFTPRAGDVITEDATNERWAVDRVNPIGGVFQPRAWKLFCSRAAS